MYICSQHEDSNLIYYQLFMVSPIYSHIFKFILPLTFRVDVNFADVEGYTALHYACLRKNFNVAKLLLDAKADRNAQ